jgi:hypothetical protein
MSRFLSSFLIAISSFAIGNASDASVSFLSYTGNDLFPSYIIATATVDWNGDEQRAEDKKTDEGPELEDGEIPLYGDENGSIGVEIQDVTEGEVITVEMVGDGFLKKSKFTMECYESYDVIHVFPKAHWDYDALRRCTQQKPASLKLRISVDGELIEEINETVLLRSINDCPFYVKLDEGEGELEDISVTFAAYVNEGHPWIDGLLKESLVAAKGSGLSGFSGYQAGDREEVLLQVFAIWHALQRRGIKYSDVSTTPPSKYVYSQTVRFLEDTVQCSQANCVDGSVLMASILRRIGLDAYLVMVPGHCFLAFTDGNKDNPTMFGLETTLLGSDDLHTVKNLEMLPESLKQEEYAVSYATFVAALESGKRQLNDHQEAFESAENPSTQLISISEARDMGVMPLGAALDEAKRFLSSN